MSFLHPEFFYYMLPPLLLLFTFILRKKDFQADFFSEEVMTKLRVGTNTLSLRGRNILFAIISVLIVIGLAEPVIKDGQVEVKSKSADIVIALDISDSMLAEDVYPNRLKFAKEKAMELLRIAPNERIGIVAFAKNSYLVSPMSFDHDAVGFLFKQLSTDSITEKGTNFLSLLNVVESTIKTTHKKNLLILSDGGDLGDFSAEIAYAKDKNIAVYILAIGTKKGAPIKKEDGSFITYKGEVIISKLNANIVNFSTATGGVYIESMKSSDDIKVMLHEIESSSEKKELKTEIIEKFIPLFHYPVGLALFLLLVAMSSLQRVSPLMLIVVTLTTLPNESKAGLLDFLDLKEARKAYVDGNYTQAEKKYSQHANDTNNSQSYYNLGNAFYKQNKYDEAIKAYQKTNFDNNMSQAKNKANLGNTYVRQAKEKALENAIKSYEKSLQLSENKEVRENLEAVKKALEEQKKEKENKDEKNKDEKNNEDNEQNKKQDSNEQKNNDDSKESQKETTENSEKKESEEKKEEDSNDKESDEQDKQGDKEKLEEIEKNKADGESHTPNTNIPQEEKMSDAEEKKWLNKLNRQQNTYMYKLNKPNQENTDEKPW